VRTYKMMLKLMFEHFHILYTGWIYCLQLRDLFLGYEVQLMHVDKPTDLDKTLRVLITLIHGWIQMEARRGKAR
jgi:hypothetical protein